MEIIKNDLRLYGINPAKGRNYENITYVLVLISNILQARVEGYLKPHKLSAVQFNLLMLAAYQNNGKGITQVEIAKHLIASASNITKVVEKSVKEGLIKRTVNPTSRRENIICITPKGKRLIDKIWCGYDKLVRSLTEEIPSKSRLQTEKILNNWLNSLQQEK